MARDWLRLATGWASELGLAEAPMFAGVGDVARARHSVLLDGASGSFAMSVSDSENAIQGDPRSWIWSADLSHHVTVTPSIVRIVRWDDLSNDRTFKLESVAGKLEPFYKFLVSDKAPSSLNIVSHSLEAFRRVRALIRNKGGDDDTSIDLFLLWLAVKAHHDGFAVGDLAQVARESGVSDRAQGALGLVGVDALEDQTTQFVSLPVRGRTLQFLPDLVVRHAGGLLFQEAHFNLLSTNPPDLFGYFEAPSVDVSTRGGTHFTPPTLARSVVDQALIQLQPINTRRRFTLFDPACGSGAFLHEAMRGLRREGFSGQLVVRGIDVSSPGVAMARFTLQRAANDWPEVNADIQITHADALGGVDWPDADLIVMNPPFIAWGGMNEQQREVVRAELGATYKGKADYSMAFVKRACERINNGGAIGTLMPASLLSSSHATRWRQYLREIVTPSFVGTIGDHGLFPHAIVQVATVVFRKQHAQADDVFSSLWSAPTSVASSDALRTLRRSVGRKVSTPDWKISLEPVSSLVALDDWRPRPSRLDHIRDVIAVAVPTAVGDLFKVEQGIRSGHNKAFLLNDSDYKKLPPKERKFFRQAVQNRDIHGGRIVSTKWLFYPGTDGLPIIETESELKRLLPAFYKTKLRDNRVELLARAGMSQNQLGATKWWELVRDRKSLATHKPKLISTYFGCRGAFAWDDVGDVLILQGHFWLPKPSLEKAIKAIPADARQRLSESLCAAYLALLNSRVFESLLAEYCPKMDGGQFDLSKRYISNVPLPDLASLAVNPEFGSYVAHLDTTGRSIKTSSVFELPEQAENVVAILYGVPDLSKWPLT